MTAKAAKAPTKKAKTTKPKRAAATKSKATVASESKAAAAGKPKTTEQPKNVKDSKKVLRSWNIRLAALLALEAVAVAVIGTSKTVELTTQYLAKDALATEAAGKEVLSAATRHLADVRLAWIVAGFLLVFAVAYLLAATLWRKKYEAWLERGVNNLRWVALGVGGGVAMTVVAMLSGVSDVSALALVFGSVVLASLLAASVELLGAGRRLRRLLGLGALLGVFLPWLLLARIAFGSIMYDGALPIYLYFVYASVTLLLVAFGLAVYFRVKKRGKWLDTDYTEKMFMGLSFATATILALQIFAGALQP